MVARRISPLAPETVSLAAGREVVKALEAHVAAGRSFVYETTLSSHQALRIMRVSRAAGYSVDLAFVTLNSPDLNVRRVAERVRRGGHNIPEDVIRRRYETALAKLPCAISLADDVVIFDNSDLHPVTLLQVERGSVVVQRLNAADAFHVRIAEAAAKGLDIGVDAVFLKERSSR